MTISAPRRLVRSGLILLLAAAVAAPIAQDAGTIAVGSSKPAVDRWKYAEKQMMRFINEARVADGLNALKWRKTVGYEARQHSKKMRRKQTLFHSKLGEVLADFSWSIAGENVGRGGKARTIFNAFMQSPPHRDNIMNERFRRMGVGIVSRDGVKWVTIMFLD